MKLRCVTLGSSQFQPEPFYLTFALYDAKDCRKLSEDFHMDLNEPEIENMIPADLQHAMDRLNTVEGKDTMPELNGIDEKWLLSKNKMVNMLHLKIELV